MIIITKKVNRTFHVMPGDTFNLTVNDDFGASVVINEVITIRAVIVAVARFLPRHLPVPAVRAMSIYDSPVELLNGSGSGRGAQKVDPGGGLRPRSAATHPAGTDCGIRDDSDSLHRAYLQGESRP